MKKRFDFYLFLIIFAALVPLFTFFKPGLPLTHDGQDHLARIANFYQSLIEGNLVPRWASNLNWGYGHPILMFLYPFPSYLASFFHFLDFSLVVSTKIVFGLSFLLSGLFIYFWLKEIWGREAGFAAGLLYLFAPYRFVDLYVRGAIGECWAFVWPPLISYFALKLSHQFKWGYFIGASFSLAALILSHNALSLMFLPVIFGYLGYLAYSAPKRKRLPLITHYSLFIIFGFALSFFFWFPAFFEGKYTLRDIVTRGNIVGFEPFSRLLWSSWSYGGTGSLSVQVGFLQWLVVAMAPFLIWRFFKKKDKAWLFLLFLFFCFWLAIFLILPLSRPLYLKISLLQKFQFAWRFLSLAIFPPAIFSAGLISLLSQKKKLLAVFLLLLIALLFNSGYWWPKDFLDKKESFFQKPYPGTTDTGESSPIWSVRFMEGFPRVAMAVIEGEAEVEEKGRSSTRHQFTVRAFTDARLLENTLYFPGWQVLVDGMPVMIQFQDPDYRGLMTFYLSPGEHEVVAQFKETKLRSRANLISLLAGLSLVFGLVVIKLLKR